MTPSVDKWALISLAGDHPKLVNLNPRLELEYNLKTLTLEEVLEALWGASLTIRSAILLGSPVDKVFVTSAPFECTPELVSSFLEQAPVFEPYVDWQTLMSFDTWCAPTSLFLRLVTLHKVLPEVKASLESSRLKNPTNLDRLVWTQWLNNHHVELKIHQC